MLDLGDIQGIIFSGHGHMPHSRFLFLKVTDRKSAQKWIESVIPCIVTGERRPKGSPKPKTSAHIAFTAPGLGALGLDDDAMATMPREFAEGMAAGERPRVLGDTADSAPEKWQLGGPSNPPIHVMLALYATSVETMNELTQESWYPAQAGSGVEIVYQQDSYRRCDNEPFGFRDGISQPFIEGGPITPDPGQSLLKPGEFLLGYVNEYANISTVPTVSPALDPNNLLPTDTILPNRKGFGVNGSYLVYRKLRQDVAGFWNFCAANAQNADGTPNPDGKIAMAAKLVGRWPSGAPLTLAPNADDEALGKDDERNNNFLFAKTDGQGFSCPIGSHVRRSNPRDALEPNSPERALVISNRHRVMRRGRPYENPLDDAANSPPAAATSSAVSETSARAPAADAPNPCGPSKHFAHAAHSAGKVEEMGKVEEGLLFIAINADIERQFEFIQQTWINNEKFNGLYDNKDPLIGDNDDGDGAMVLQRAPARRKIHGVPRFVQALGGGYFLLPGIRGLRFLANIP